VLFPLLLTAATAAQYNAVCNSLNVLHCSRWFGNIWLFSVSTICDNFVEVFC
jgi:hypothetical protein